MNTIVTPARLLAGAMGYRSAMERRVHRIPEVCPAALGKSSPAALGKSSPAATALGVALLSAEQRC